VLARRRVSRFLGQERRSSSSSLPQRQINKLVVLLNNLTRKSSLTSTYLKMVERPGLGKRPSSNDRGVSPPPSKRKQPSTTTSKLHANACRDLVLSHAPGKAIANFFTPLSKKEPDKMTWRVVKDSLLIGRYAASTGRSAVKGRTKIAAFDFVRLRIEPCVQP
jgi:hypothetical protein